MKTQLNPTQPNRRKAMSNPAKARFAQEIKSGDLILATDNGAHPEPVVWMKKGRLQKTDMHTQFLEIVSIELNEKSPRKWIRFDVKLADGKMLILNGTILDAYKYIVKAGA